MFLVTWATDLSLRAIKCCSVVFGVTLRLLVINISSSSPAINKLRRLLPAMCVTNGHGSAASRVDNTQPVEACDEARYFSGRESSARVTILFSYKYLLLALMPVLQSPDGANRRLRGLHPHADNVRLVSVPRRLQRLSILMPTAFAPPLSLSILTLTAL